MHFQRFLRREDTGVDPGGQSQSCPTVKVGEALRCCGNLQAPYFQETALAGMVKGIKFFNCLRCELRHGTRTVGLENNAGRV
jgi:hypothetical protein